MQTWLFLLGAALLLINCASITSAGKKVVCYHGTWATYRPGNGKFDIENIDPNLCTHVIYTFVGITSTGDIRILDSWNEIDKGGFRRTNELRNKNPNLKTLVAIGGWNEGSLPYSTVVGNNQLRAAFVNNIVKFVGEHGFDGFDLDWEYPAQRGGAASDKAAFVQLIKELRERFDQHGYLLTAAVGAAESSASISYDIPALGKYLDFINIMAYDLHGSWDPVTGHNAPLYPGVNDVTEKEKSLTVDAAIQYWIKQGAPREKIILGMGTYGRSFTLGSSGQCSMGAAATGGGTAGPYTREAGMLGYNEICEKQSSWTEKWDDQQKVPFACNGNQFVGYDNVKSIQIKTEYVLKEDLGGAMIWSVETDDFLGICNGKKYPLLSAINEVLNSGKIPPEEPTTTTTKAPGNVEPEVPTEAPATNPPAEPSSVCTKEGFVRDPNDCQTFYQCSLVSGKYVSHQLKCGNGLAFDTALNVCNWASAVAC